MSTLNHLARFQATTVLTVTITSPTQNQVITTAAPVVSWTFAPGDQLNRRVRIYQAGVLVHDSGVLATSSQSYTVPVGAITNGNTYTMIVDIVTTTGVAGQSSVRTFSTSFATSTNVTGVIITPVGGCKAPTVLPKILVQWTQVVPGGAETFVRYEVWRRVGGETTWQVIAHQTDITVTRYFDLTPNSREVYQYAVVYVATAAGSTLFSSVQSPLPIGYIEFDHLWLHVVGDSSTALRFESHQTSQSREQEISFLRPWNRAAPTAHIGQLEQNVFSVSGLELPLSLRSKWQKLLALQTAQRANSAMLCARFGAASTKVFCTLTRVSRDINVSIQGQSIDLAETHYSEDVTV